MTEAEIAAVAGLIGKPAPTFINECARAAFGAAFPNSRLDAWERQSEAFRASFRREARAVLATVAAHLQGQATTPNDARGSP